jgi:hypothetical protein
MHITPEIRRAIERSGDKPLRLEDPLKHETYVLLKASAFDRIERLLAPIIGKQDDWQLADARETFCPACSPTIGGNNTGYGATSGPD